MFFEKYTNKRKLGKGAFGHVYLVEDKQGKEYAMKLISKDKIQQHSYLQEYLEGEIQCMKKMNSPYIIKLYETLQDNDYIYLVLEYCDAGDLTIEQASLPGMVYPLEKATEVLSHVIRGLEYLHSQGYLHRDLKLQNILKSSFQGIVKLADFGFSKPQQLTKGTNLGTEQFKAPEIFIEQPYGFGVDMWAFGVLFYYMLNKQYPFKIGLYHDEEKKGKMLAQAAKNFSYEKAVKKTNKQLTKNCSKEMEDLFRRIFEIDPEKRITFIEIRQHPIFLKHFPTIQEKSRIIYNSRFNDSKSRLLKSNFLQIPKGIQNAQFQPSRIHAGNQLLTQEKEILGRRKDQIDYLKETAEVFLECQYLQHHERLMLGYNLVKYYLVLLRRFSDQLRVDVLNKLYPNKKWTGYSETKQFKQLVKEVNRDLISYELKFVAIYDECSFVLESINNANPHFKEGFSQTINEVQFDGPFKKSYRQSTRLAYRVLIKLMGKQRGNIIPYLLTMNAICHAFNQIFDNPQNAATIFGIYLEQKHISPNKINYSKLREWLSQSSDQTLRNVVTQILTFYQV